MRLLIVIPHFYRNAEGRDDSTTGIRRKHGSSTMSVQSRAAALSHTVMSLHQSFGSSQAMIRHADRRTITANESTRGEIHIAVVTTRREHLLDQTNFAAEICYRVTVDDDPVNLGFACHRVLRDRWGNYDYYGFLEDDLALQDPWFFEKLRWFNSYVGYDSVLLPNRFERSSDLAYKKCYLDGDLGAHVTRPFQDVSDKPELQSKVMGKAVRFVRPLNPHSGCFFLHAEQMQRWMRQPGFGKPSAAFIGPLESASTLGIMQTFRIYKPAPENAAFLEIEHAGDRFIRLIRKA